MITRVALLIGTRPEIIKMAPVIRALKKSKSLKPIVISSGQQKELTRQTWKSVGIIPDLDFKLMKQNQNLAILTGEIIAKVFKFLNRSQPAALLVHGDTTTAFAGALAAFYAKVKIGHVEAGLRTYDYERPYPEEMNRRLIDPIARWCFAPTPWAKSNLIKEKIEKEKIYVTGNTAIDNLLYSLKKANTNYHQNNKKKLILITGHRRESFGAGFKRICTAIKLMAQKWPQAEFVYPVHLNPHVQKPVFSILGKHSRISLIPPVGYQEFIGLMKRSHFILSDSGGVQEEAPSLGKPVLVMRDVTERPEGLLAGTCKLVGTSTEKIMKEASVLMENEEEYLRRKKIRNPYGDGKAGQRICRILEKSLN